MNWPKWVQNWLMPLKARPGYLREVDPADTIDDEIAYPHEIAYTALRDFGRSSGLGELYGKVGNFSVRARWGNPRPRPPDTAGANTDAPRSP